MQTMKYREFNAAGEREDFTVPKFILPREVAEKLYNSTVFVFLPRGWRGIDSTTNHWKAGPCWAVCGDRGDFWISPREPQTDADAAAILRDLDFMGAKGIRR